MTLDKPFSDKTLDSPKISPTHASVDCNQFQGNDCSDYKNIPALSTECVLNHEKCPTATTTPETKTPDKVTRCLREDPNSNLLPVHLQAQCRMTPVPVACPTTANPETKTPSTGSPQPSPKPTSTHYTVYCYELDFANCQNLGWGAQNMEEACQSVTSECPDGWFHFNTRWLVRSNCDLNRCISVVINDKVQPDSKGITSKTNNYYRDETFELRAESMYFDGIPFRNRGGPIRYYLGDQQVPRRYCV